MRKLWACPISMSESHKSPLVLKLLASLSLVREKKSVKLGSLEMEIFLLPYRVKGDTCESGSRSDLVYLFSFTEENLKLIEKLQSKHLVVT